MKKAPPKRSKSSKPEPWGQPHHILLVIIILQGGFMIFMGLQGPSHHQSRARVAPHHHRPTNKAWRQSISRSASEDRQDKLRQRINEAAKKTISPETIKRHKDTLQKVKRKINPPKATSPPQYKSMLQSREWEVNSMEFPGSLHFHFVQEQEEPYFRNENQKTNEELMEKYNAAAKEAPKHMVRKHKTLDSCYYFSEETQQLRFKQWCFEVGRKGYSGVIAFNPQPFARTWCGKTIQPNTVQHYSKLCANATMEPARILVPESDKLLGTQRRDWKHLPPIVFERKDSYGSIEAVQDCDVPCKFSMDTCLDQDDNDLKGAACLPEVSDWTVQGTDFKFRYSMLDPRLAPSSIGISRKAYREHQFYATRSFQSEIPLSTFDWDRYGEMNTPHNDFKKAGKKGICFMHLEPCTGEIRPGTWVSKVQEAFKGNFDYYGPCNFGPNMKSTPTKLDVNKYQDRQTIMGQYMFIMIIGHSQAPDMMTDLIWDALTAGSIPVYHGAPNVREHVPPNSIIVGGEHSGQQALAEHLNSIMESRKLWRELHLWRDEEETAASLIQQKYGFLKEKSSSSYCRMCRWALATKYALGWDPVKQTIEKPALDRKFCVSPKDEMKGPIEELWMSDLSMQRPLGRKICQKESAEQTFEFDDLSITRKATSHANGVIDIAITDIKSLRKNLKIVLRLGFGISNVYGAHIIEPHQVLKKEDNPSDHISIMSSIAIQDDKTRATIITNWATELNTPKKEGLVDILIKDLKKPGDGQPRTQKRNEILIGNPQTSRLMQEEVLKIRIILEDVNRLRDGWTEYNLSPYARLMITDFLDPLMFFYIK